MNSQAPSFLLSIVNIITALLKFAEPCLLITMGKLIMTNFCSVEIFQMARYLLTVFPSYLVTLS